jgi:hypothetical protein
LSGRTAAVCAKVVATDGKPGIQDHALTHIGPQSELALSVTTARPVVPTFDHPSGPQMGLQTIHQRE